jgi:hypothetical protein
MDLLRTMSNCKDGLVMSGERRWPARPADEDPATVELAA